ncbi:hypothetical protein [Streptomyces sp. SID3343]|uniref:hypothetical protein n=1 Tax=Streptomyces sp. SID3343 TaxID=2690260 RepID=UPI001367A46E|nr:hypothetical protein [Streptomyces sp. SID3343]
MTSTLMIGLLIASMAAEDTKLPMPSLVGESTIPVPLPFLTPLAVVSAAVAGLERGDRRLGSTSSRLRGVDLAFLVGLFLVGALVPGITEVLGDSGMGGAFVRNLAGYLGLGLIARHYLGGPVATVVPVVFVLFCTAVGLDASRRPRPWAWPLAPADDLGAAAVCVVLGVAGLYAVTRPRATVGA